MKSLQNKLAFITGGSSGIGLETSRVLAEHGCRIVLLARRKDPLHEAQEYIKEQLSSDVVPDISFMTMDVADNSDVREKIKALSLQFGVPDILINSAGIGLADYLQNIDYHSFDQVMKVNLYGTRNTIAAVVPLMQENQSGQIVNISSMAGFIGMFGYSAYSSSKFALVGFSECIRSELKPDNIGVTLVCPPEVDTPLIKEEAKTIPPEAKAFKSMAGKLSTEHTAQSIVKGIKKNKFLVIPGSAAKFSYFLHRISSGHLTRLSMDLISSIYRRS